MEVDDLDVFSLLILFLQIVVCLSGICIITLHRAIPSEMINSCNTI